MVKEKMPKNEIINKFWGKYRFLSNFYKVSIAINGIEYPSTEHYYQAMKFKDPELQERIRMTDKPGDAKKIAHQHPVRDDWNEISFSFMEKALRAKFSIPKFKEKLLETGDAILQEGNTWGDTFWGIDSKTGKGQNHLGKMLMKIREELKAEKDS